MGSWCSCCKETPVVHPVITKERTLSIRKPSYVGNLNDLGISTTDPLRLINGYEREPVVSLEESLEPLDSHIQYLSDQINHAKASCRRENPHSLTHDEAAAIYLYSMQGDPYCLHEYLEKAWKTDDRSQMMPWFRYLKLLRTALDKLPDVKGEVWKGTEYDPILANTLLSNALPFYTCMGSCSTSMNELKRDLQEKSITRMMFAGYESADAKNMAGYTESNSNQVLIWPGIKLKEYVKYTMDGNGSMITHFTGTSNSIKYVPARTPIPPSGRKSTSVRPMEKHFVCQALFCQNRCRADHPLNHCYGFAFLSHKCSHHCGPKPTCAVCHNEHTDLRECNKCQERFCEKCCFK